MGLTQITTGGVDDNINIDSNTLKVDGTNNRVGIGTAAPASKFTVADNGYSPIEIQSDRTTATDNIGGLHFKSATTNVAYIQSLVDGTLKFRNTSSLTERMRIDTSGNVQVSTGQFTVGTTATTGLQFINDGTFGTLNSAPLKFRTASTERMRINSGGKVLINTTAPSGYSDRLLTVGDISLSSSNVEIRSATNGWGGLVFSDSTASDVNSYRGSIEYSHGTNHMQFRTDAVERMRLTSAGHLGIGTSSPPRALTNADDVTLTTGNAPQFRLNGTAADDNDNARAIFGLATANTHFFNTAVAGDAILRAPNDGNLLLGEGVTERMRLDASGRLAVGLSTPRTAGAGGHAQLQVVSPTSPTSDINVIAAKFQGNTSASSGECLIACAAGYSISANDTEGHALFGAAREGNGNNAGFIVKTGTGNVERFRISSGGVITTNTVQQHFDRGASTGNSTFSRDFSIGATQSALITAAFNHYGLFGYGCTRISFAATGASFSTETVHNQTTGNGGGWTITRPTTSTLRVTKTAGTYNGSGHWYIHVIAS